MDILREIDNTLTEDDLVHIIEEVDEDGSGTMDFDEFVNHAGVDDDAGDDDDDHASDKGRVGQSVDRVCPSWARARARAR